MLTSNTHLKIAAHHQVGGRPRLFPPGDGGCGPRTCSQGQTTWRSQDGCRQEALLERARTASHVVVCSEAAAVGASENLVPARARHWKPNFNVRPAVVSRWEFPVALVLPSHPSGVF